jgi:hypothetical protein
MADTPHMNTPARKFLEKMGYGNPVSMLTIIFIYIIYMISPKAGL